MRLALGKKEVMLCALYTSKLKEEASPQQRLREPPQRSRACVVFYSPMFHLSHVVILPSAVSFKYTT